MKWSELSMTEKNEVIKMAVAQGIKDISSIKNLYEESVNRSRRFEDGGDTNPAMTGMMKSKLATAAHFGNPTARRMTNYDTRSFTWPGEYEYDRGIGEPKRGNVFVSSYGNLVTPQIQDTGNGLSFIENVWSPENDQRSYLQSLKFNNEKDARYFGEHYKEIAPMMHLYELGGPKRGRMPAHPRRGNEEKDPEAIAAYQQYESDMAERRKVSAERARQYIEEKARRNIEAAKELNRRKDVVISQLEDEASSIPFTGEQIKQAAEQQREDRLNTWRPIVNMADIATNAVGIMSGNPWILGAVATPDIIQTIDHAANEGIKGSDLLSLGFDALGILGASNVLKPLKYSYRQKTTNRYGLPIERDREIKYGEYLDAFSDWGGKLWGVKDGGDDAIDLWNFGRRVNPNSQFYFRPFSLAEGGSIHIAPSKRGTFTAAASKHGMGVQEFASKVLAHPENYSLTMRKKANFARNASKWKH